MTIGSERSRLRTERQQLLARESLPGEPRRSEDDLFESLALATQERELLVREKGLLEQFLKSTTDEVSRMLEVEAASEEQRYALEEKVRQTEMQQRHWQAAAEEERRSAKHARSEAATLQEQLNASQDKCVEAERSSACLERKVNALQSELEAVRSLALHARNKDEWERQEARVMDAEASARQHQERIAQMLQQAGEHAKERALWVDQQKTLHATADEVKTLRAQVEVLKRSEARAAELEKECDGLQQNARLTAQRMDQQQRTLETNAGEMAALRDENKELTVRLAEHQSSNAMLKSRIERSEQDAAAAVEALTEQTSRNRNLEAEAAANANRLTASAAQVEICKKESAALSRELDTASKSAEDSKREAAELSKAVATLQKDCQRAQELEMTLSRAREAAEAEKLALRREIQEAFALRQKDADSLAALRGENAELQTRCDALASDKIAFQDDCSRLNFRVQVKVGWWGSEVARRRRR